MRHRRRMLADKAIPIEFDGEHGDLAPFAVLDELAGRARVAYLVEMDHFIREKYDFRLLRPLPRLTRLALVRRGACRRPRWAGR